MEKLPHFIFIGNVEEKHKKRREKELAETLTIDIRLSLSPEEMNVVRENEITKTPEQEVLFAQVDQHINRLMSDLGVESFEYPVHNIFIVRKDRYSQISTNGIALADIGSQRIFLKERKHDYQLASALFHEILHIKGKVVVQLLRSQDDSEKVEGHMIRAGLGVMPPYKNIEHGDEQDHYLVGVEEAVVARQQAFFNQVIRHWESFSDVREKFQSDDGKAVLQKIEEATGIANENVIWFDKEKKTFDVLGFIPQREVLDYICHEVSSQLNISFEDVHKEFLKSHFTGHLINLAKMVERTFGKGSFRVLATMPAQNDEKVREVFDELKQKRKEIITTQSPRSARRSRPPRNPSTA